MRVYGLLILAVGGGLLAAVALVARWIHRRWRTPYALLTVGVITTPARWRRSSRSCAPSAARCWTSWRSARSCSGCWPVQRGDRAVLGYQYLARGAVTRPQA